MTAPWARDLARGLQYQSRHDGPEPRTVSLLARLGGPGITAADAVRMAETVDLAAVLTLGRVLEQVLGPGAGARDPRANEAAAPWLGGLKLGSRIHLVQELLRLLPPAGTAAGADPAGAAAGIRPPGQPGEARRSSSSSACPDSTPVRISRATASSSATCGLVSE